MRWDIHNLRFAKALRPLFCFKLENSVRPLFICGTGRCKPKTAQSVDEGLSDEMPDTVPQLGRPAKSLRTASVFGVLCAAVVNFGCSFIATNILPPDNFGPKLFVKTYKNGENFFFDVSEVHFGILLNITVERVEKDYSRFTMWGGYVESKRIGSPKITFPIEYGQYINMMIMSKKAFRIDPGHYRINGEMYKCDDGEKCDYKNMITLHGNFVVNDDLAVISVNSDYP